MTKDEVRKKIITILKSTYLYEVEEKRPGTTRYAANKILNEIIALGFAPPVTGYDIKMTKDGIIKNPIRRFD